MDIPELELDDVVIFELPTVEVVAAFRERLRPQWDGWSDADGQLWLFTARLEENAGVAALLREAQALAAEHGVPSIRFYLDGRLYTLEAAAHPTQLAA